jgi:hypothetical protein
MVEFERERERERVSEIYDIVIMTSRVLKVGPGIEGCYYLVGLGKQSNRTEKLAVRHLFRSRWFSTFYYFFKTGQRGFGKLFRRSLTQKLFRRKNHEEKIKM